MEEECEREIAIEQEEEIIRELPPAVPAVKETEWKFTRILESDPISVRSCLDNFLSLTQLFNKTVLYNEWKQIPSLKHVLVSKNFLKTVNSDHLDEFLKPIDYILYYQSHYLLISLYEADNVASILRQTPTNQIRLLKLHYLPQTGFTPDTLRMTTLLKLANGNTMFSSAEEKSAVVQLLNMVPRNELLLPQLDASILGVKLVEKGWKDSWDKLHAAKWIDQTGFLLKVVAPPQSPGYSVSMLTLINGFPQHRCFHTNPRIFIIKLLNYRGTTSDFKCSTLEDLFGIM
jgi:hypothetical protein